MPDNESSVQPIYRQIAEKIATEIKAGTRPANSKIPSERELAEEFGISRMTARTAVNSLVRQGVVVRRNRAGAYVTQPKFRFDLSSSAGLHEQLHKIGVKPGARIIVAEKVLANALDPEVMQALALTGQDEIYRIIRLRTANDDSVAIENSYFPAHFFPGLLDFNLTDSIYGILKKYFSIEPTGSVQEMEITFLSEQWADMMGVTTGLPTVEIKRRTVTTDNRPFEFAHDIYRGDRLVFIAQTIGPTLNLGATNV